MYSEYLITREKSFRFLWSRTDGIFSSSYTKSWEQFQQKEKILPPFPDRYLEYKISTLRVSSWLCWDNGASTHRDSGFQNHFRISQSHFWEKCFPTSVTDVLWLLSHKFISRVFISVLYSRNDLWLEDIRNLFIPKPLLAGFWIISERTLKFPMYLIFM